MFRGQYLHGVDDKGRVAIPAKFREILSARYEERLIITHFDGCLWAYPAPIWQQLEDRVAQLPQFQKEVKTLQRAFLSPAQECVPDKQGRILLPQNLRDYARIEREAMMVGMTQRIEIWSKASWDKMFEEAQKNLETMQAKLAELGL